MGLVCWFEILYQPFSNQSQKKTTQPFVYVKSTQPFEKSDVVHSSKHATRLRNPCLQAQQLKHQRLQAVRSYLRGWGRLVPLYRQGFSTWTIQGL